MSAAEILRTQRLIGRRLQLEDQAENDRLHHDPQVMATLGGVRTDEQSRQYHERNLEALGQAWLRAVDVLRSNPR